MHWLRIDPLQLMQAYGAWLKPRLLSNNRVIGFLGLAETPYVPIADASAWVLHSSDGRVLQILARIPREIALVNHPELIPNAEQLAAIRLKFPGSWLLTCHEDQCDSWEASGKTLGFKDIPLLCTLLYQVKPHQLRRSALPEGLRFEPLSAFNRQIGRFIQGFMLDALQQRADLDEQKLRFGKQKFFGLLKGQQLLSTAAITRSSFNGRCLSYVYTPKGLRGNDYAGLAVEYISRTILEQAGMETVFLYADQDNPFSNRLYQKLGFEFVCYCKAF